MARQEQPREDLLAEATALVQRAELRVEGHEEPVVIGFRDDGAASIFLGEQPVYHFNAAGQLRRAFADDRLYKAQGGNLVSLVRRREADCVALVRHELNHAETTRFRQELADVLRGLCDAIDRERYELVGQVPADADTVPRFAAWLQSVGEEPAIAQRAALGG